MELEYANKQVKQVFCCDCVTDSEESGRFICVIFAQPFRGSSLSLIGISPPADMKE